MKIKFPCPKALVCVVCFVLLCALAIVGLACSSKEVPTVVVYTALDEMYSRPILDAFERDTGIHVEPVYDTEAAKTTGLVTRLIQERNRPRADVFWNNEVAQTIVLKNKEVLAQYRSPSADAIPAKFKDADGYWAAFAARGRVLIYNTGLVETPPTSILDFTKEEWRGKAAIAKPLFGTTATHGAALFVLWGDEKAKAFFKALNANDVAVLAGNATVRDLVAQGEYAVGLTDTDDANGAIEDGLPAQWLFPDQGADGIGTLVIPNTVALIKDGPNSEGGKRLIDYLLSPGVEAQLARMRSIQIPLNPAVEAPEGVPKLEDIKTMQVDFSDVAAKMGGSARYFQEEFLR